MGRRLLVWLRRIRVELRRKWWVWLLLVFERLVEHHILAVIDEYANSHKNAVAKVLKQIIRYVGESPVAISVILAIAILLALIIHAYFETRPARTKTIIRGEGGVTASVPQFSGTLEMTHIPARGLWAKVRRSFRRKMR